MKYYSLGNDYKIELNEEHICISDKNNKQKYYDKDVNMTNYIIIKYLLLYNNHNITRKDLLDYDERLSSENSINKAFERLRTFIKEPYLIKEKTQFQYLKEITKEEYNSFFLSIKQTNHIISLNQHINTGQYDYLFDDYCPRDMMIENINHHISRDRICGLIGGPGCGKTSLALLYAHYYTDDYKDMFIFHCENETVFRKSLGISYQDEYENLREIVLKLIDILTNHTGRYLLIFDNITFDDKKLSSNEYMFFEYFIQKIINHIHQHFDHIDIITTSRAKIAAKHNLYVQELLYDEAKDYLMDVSFLCSEKDIDMILKETCLPIVLSNIKRFAIMLGGYQEIKSIHHTFSNEKTLRDLIKELFVSLSLSNHGTIYIKILKICSILYNSIDKELLYEYLERLGYHRNLIDSILLEYQYKLNILIYNNDFYSIHKSYQETILSYFIDNNEYESYVSVFIEFLSEKIDSLCFFNSNKVKYIEAYVVHIDRIFRYKQYHSILFDKLLYSVLHHYGANYSIHHPYYIHYNEYLLNKCTDINHDLLILTQYEISNHPIDQYLLSFINKYKDNPPFIIRLYYVLGLLSQNKKEEYYHRCIEETKKISKEYTDYRVYAYQHRLDAYLMLTREYREHRLYDKMSYYRQLCMDEIEYIKNLKLDQYHEIEFMEAKIYNSFGVSFIEMNKDIGMLEDGYSYEIKAYHIFNRYFMYSYILKILHNVSLYYKLHCTYINNPIDYLYDTINSLYYIELYHYSKNYYHIHNTILDINYYMQSFLTLYSLLNVSYKTFNNIYIRIYFNIHKPLIDNHAIIEELDKFINKCSCFTNQHDYVYYIYELALSKLIHGIQCCFEEEIDFDHIDISNTKYQRYSLVMYRYYGMLCRKIGQLTDHHELLLKAEYHLLKVTEFNKKIHNNGQIALCIRELGIIYEILNKKEELIDLLKNSRSIFEQLSENDGIRKNWYIPVCHKYK